MSKLVNLPPPEPPAKIRQGHVADRLTSIVAGASKAWRNTDESALASYAFRGLLQGGNPKYNTQEREAAGNLYRGLWEAVQGSGRDSTQLDIVQNGSGAPIQELQSTAVKQLVSIDSHLSVNDRKIIRNVCCADWWPSQAIRDIDPDYKFATVARFREAMDSLIEAIEKAKKTRYAFSLVRE